MKNNLNKIANALKIILVIAAIIMLVSCSKQPANPNIPNENPKSNISQTQNKSLNPNTGNLYEDIKIRLKEILK